MSPGAKIKDPAIISRDFQELMAAGDEFPIKVEGTKTLPYAGVLMEWEPGSRRMLVKLLRPLPPALAEGAVFEMVYSAQGKRFECRIVFQGREGYLRYEFQGPAFLLASDRRLWKRYPIRPRENFHITAQDSEIPGHGFAGPLLDLSQDGLAFRVDRMLRLEDGMPIRPGGHLFDRGKVLSLIRVKGFPKGEILEARGQVVRVHEADSELHLGIQFTGLGDAEKMLLVRFLEVRERHSTQGSGGFQAGTGRVEWPEARPEEGEDAAPPADGEEAGEEEAREEEPGAEQEIAPPDPDRAGLEALAALDRRSSRVLLVSPPAEDRERISRGLEAAGFWRIDPAPGLFEAHALWKEAGPSPYRVLLVDLEPNRVEGLENVGAARHLEPLLRAFGALPVAHVTRIPDPMLDLLERPGLAALAQEGCEDGGWIPVLEGLLGSR